MPLRNIPFSNFIGVQIFESNSIRDEHVFSGIWLYRNEVEVIPDRSGGQWPKFDSEVIQMLSFHSYTECINYIILWRFDICQNNECKSKANCIWPCMSHILSRI